MKSLSNPVYEDIWIGSPTFWREVSPEKAGMGWGGSQGRELSTHNVLTFELDVDFFLKLYI